MKLFKMKTKFVIIFLFVCVAELPVVRSQTKTTLSQTTCNSPGIPGVPGVPGNHGLPGSRGLAGMKGEPGVKGEPGEKNDPGARGKPGPKGEPGEKNDPGAKGESGVKGEPGERGYNYADLVKSNWKQCVWKRQDAKDAGLIQNCIFNKKYDNTSLRVFYEGTLRSYGSGSCNRWYFTFDGAECTKPATIEGVVYVASAQVSALRHRHIEGYCDQVLKGRVRVGFWIGKCAGQSVGTGNTGWNSGSRIVIEEVPPPQA